MLAPKRKPPRSFKYKNYPGTGLPSLSFGNDTETSRTSHGDSENSSNVVIERIVNNEPVTIGDTSSVSLNSLKNILKF